MSYEKQYKEFAFFAGAGVVGGELAPNYDFTETADAKINELLQTGDTVFGSNLIDQSVDDGDPIWAKLKGYSKSVTDWCVKNTANLSAVGYGAASFLTTDMSLPKPGDIDYNIEKSVTEQWIRAADNMAYGYHDKLKTKKTCFLSDPTDYEAKDVYNIIAYFRKKYRNCIMIKESMLKRQSFQYKMDNDDRNNILRRILNNETLFLVEGSKQGETITIRTESNENKEYELVELRYLQDNVSGNYLFNTNGPTVLYDGCEIMVEKSYDVFEQSYVICCDQRLHNARRSDDDPHVLVASKESDPILTYNDGNNNATFNIVSNFVNFLTQKDVSQSEILDLAEEQIMILVKKGQARWVSLKYVRKMGKTEKEYGYAATYAAKQASEQALSYFSIQAKLSMLSSRLRKLPKSLQSWAVEQCPKPLINPPYNEGAVLPYIFTAQDFETIFDIRRTWNVDDFEELGYFFGQTYSKTRYMLTLSNDKNELHTESALTELYNSQQAIYRFMPGLLPNLPHYLPFGLKLPEYRNSEIDWGANMGENISDLYVCGGMIEIVSRSDKSYIVRLVVYDLLTGKPAIPLAKKLLDSDETSMTKTFLLTEKQIESQLGSNKIEEVSADFCGNSNIAFDWTNMTANASALSINGATDRQAITSFLGEVFADGVWQCRREILKQNEWRKHKDDILVHKEADIEEWLNHGNTFDGVKNNVSELAYWARGKLQKPSTASLSDKTYSELMSEHRKSFLGLLEFNKKKTLVDVEKAVVYAHSAAKVTAAACFQPLIEAKITQACYDMGCGDVSCRPPQSLFMQLSLHPTFEDENTVISETEELYIQTKKVTPYKTIASESDLKNVVAIINDVIAKSEDLQTKYKIDGPTTKQFLLFVAQCACCNAGENRHVIEAIMGLRFGSDIFDTPEPPVPPEETTTANSFDKSEVNEESSEEILETLMEEAEDIAGSGSNEVSKKIYNVAKLVGKTAAVTGTAVTGIMAMPWAVAGAAVVDLQIMAAGYPGISMQVFQNLFPLDETVDIEKLDEKIEILNTFLEEKKEKLNKEINKYAEEEEIETKKNELEIQNNNTDIVIVNLGQNIKGMKTPYVNISDNRTQFLQEKAKKIQIQYYYINRLSHAITILDQIGIGLKKRNLPNLIGETTYEIVNNDQYEKIKNETEKQNKIFEMGYVTDNLLFRTKVQNDNFNYTMTFDMFLKFVQKFILLIEECIKKTVEYIKFEDGVIKEKLQTKFGESKIDSFFKAYSRLHETNVQRNPSDFLTLKLNIVLKENGIEEFKGEIPANAIITKEVFILFFRDLNDTFTIKTNLKLLYRNYDGLFNGIIDNELEIETSFMLLDKPLKLRNDHFNEFKKKVATDGDLFTQYKIFFDQNHILYDKITENQLMLCTSTNEMMEAIQDFSVPYSTDKFFENKSPLTYTEVNNLCSNMNTYSELTREQHECLKKLKSEIEIMKKTAITWETQDDCTTYQEKCLQVLRYYNTRYHDIPQRKNIATLIDHFEWWHSSNGKCYANRFGMDFNHFYLKYLNLQYKLTKSFLMCTDLVNRVTMPDLNEIYNTATSILDDLEFRDNNDISKKGRAFVVFLTTNYNIKKPDANFDTLFQYFSPENTEDNLVTVLSKIEELLYIVGLSLTLNTQDKLKELFMSVMDLKNKNELIQCMTQSDLITVAGMKTEFDEKSELLHATYELHNKDNEINTLNKFTMENLQTLHNNLKTLKGIFDKFKFDVQEKNSKQKTKFNLILALKKFSAFNTENNITFAGSMFGEVNPSTAVMNANENAARKHQKIINEKLDQLQNIASKLKNTDPSFEEHQNIFKQNVVTYIETQRKRMERFVKQSARKYNVDTYTFIPQKTGFVSLADVKEARQQIEDATNGLKTFKSSKLGSPPRYTDTKLYDATKKQLDSLGQRYYSLRGQNKMYKTITHDDTLYFESVSVNPNLQFVIERAEPTNNSILNYDKIIFGGTEKTTFYFPFAHFGTTMKRRMNWNRRSTTIKENYAPEFMHMLPLSIQTNADKKAYKDVDQKSINSISVQGISFYDPNTKQMFSSPLNQVYKPTENAKFIPEIGDIIQKNNVWYMVTGRDTEIPTDIERIQNTEGKNINVDEDWPSLSSEEKKKRWVARLMQYIDHVARFTKETVNNSTFSLFGTEDKFSGRFQYQTTTAAVTICKMGQWLKKTLNDLQETEEDLFKNALENLKTHPTIIEFQEKWKTCTEGYSKDFTFWVDYWEDYKTAKGYLEYRRGTHMYANDVMWPQRNGLGYYNKTLHEWFICLLLGDGMDYEAFLKNSVDINWRPRTPTEIQTLLNNKELWEKYNGEKLEWRLVDENQYVFESKYFLPEDVLAYQIKNEKVTQKLPLPSDLNSNVKKRKFTLYLNKKNWLDPEQLLQDAVMFYLQLPKSFYSQQQEERLNDYQTFASNRLQAEFAHSFVLYTLAFMLPQFVVPHTILRAVKTYDHSKAAFNFFDSKHDITNLLNAHLEEMTVRKELFETIITKRLDSIVNEEDKKLTEAVKIAHALNAMQGLRDLPLQSLSMAFPVASKMTFKWNPAFSFVLKQCTVVGNQIVTATPPEIRKITDGYESYKNKLFPLQHANRNFSIVGGDVRYYSNTFTAPSGRFDVIPGDIVKYKLTGANNDDPYIVMSTKFNERVDIRKLVNGRFDNDEGKINVEIINLTPYYAKKDFSQSQEILSVQQKFADAIFGNDATYKIGDAYKQTIGLTYGCISNIDYSYVKNKNDDEYKAIPARIKINFETQGRLFGKSVDSIWLTKKDFDTLWEKLNDFDDIESTTDLYELKMIQSALEKHRASRLLDKLVGEEDNEVKLAVGLIQFDNHFYWSKFLKLFASKIKVLLEYGISLVKRIGKMCVDIYESVQPYFTGVVHAYNGALRTATTFRDTFTTWVNGYLKRVFSAMETASEYGINMAPTIIFGYMLYSDPGKLWRWGAGLWNWLFGQIGAAKGKVSDQLRNLSASASSIGGVLTLSYGAVYVATLLGKKILSYCGYDIQVAVGEILKVICTRVLKAVHLEGMFHFSTPFVQKAKDDINKLNEKMTDNEKKKIYEFCQNENTDEVCAENTEDFIEQNGILGIYRYVNMLYKIAVNGNLSWNELRTAVYKMFHHMFMTTPDHFIKLIEDRSPDLAKYIRSTIQSLFSCTEHLSTILLLTFSSMAKRLGLNYEFSMASGRSVSVLDAATKEAAGIEALSTSEAEVKASYAFAHVAEMILKATIEDDSKRDQYMPYLRGASMQAVVHRLFDFCAIPPDRIALLLTVSPPFVTKEMVSIWQTMTLLGAVTQALRAGAGSVAESVYTFGHQILPVTFELAENLITLIEIPVRLIMDIISKIFSATIKLLKKACKLAGVNFMLDTIFERTRDVLRLFTNKFKGYFNDETEYAAAQIKKENTDYSDDQADKDAEQLSQGKHSILKTLAAAVNSFYACIFDIKENGDGTSEEATKLSQLAQVINNCYQELLEISSLPYFRKAKKRLNNLIQGVLNGVKTKKMLVTYSAHLYDRYSSTTSDSAFVPVVEALGSVAKHQMLYKPLKDFLNTSTLVTPQLYFTDTVDCIILRLYDVARRTFAPMIDAMITGQFCRQQAISLGRYETRLALSVMTSAFASYAYQTLRPLIKTAIAVAVAVYSESSALLVAAAGELLWENLPLSMFYDFCTSYNQICAGIFEPAQFQVALPIVTPFGETLQTPLLTWSGATAVGFPIANTKKSYFDFNTSLTSMMNSSVGKLLHTITQRIGGDMGVGILAGTISMKYLEYLNEKMKKTVNTTKISQEGIQHVVVSDRNANTYINRFVYENAYGAAIGGQQAQIQARFGSKTGTVGYVSISIIEENLQFYLTEQITSKSTLEDVQIEILNKVLSLWTETYSSHKNDDEKELLLKRYSTFPCLVVNKANTPFNTGAISSIYNCKQPLRRFIGANKYAEIAFKKIESEDNVSEVKTAMTQLFYELLISTTCPSWYRPLVRNMDADWHDSKNWLLQEDHHRTLGYIAYVHGLAPALQINGQSEMARKALQYLKPEPRDRDSYTEVFASHALRKLLQNEARLLAAKKKDHEVTIYVIF